MAVSGLFLCLFLLVHVLGNSPLLLPGGRGQVAFNHYAELLSGLLLIKLAGLVTLAAIGLHAALALSLAWRARVLSGTSARVSPSPATSRWSSRFMGATGALVLVFLVVHLWDFWWPYKFGGDSLPLDPAGRRDLYTLVGSKLGGAGHAALYLLTLLALGVHLRHGVWSGLRSLGLHAPGLARAARLVGTAFGVLVAAAFAAMVLVAYSGPS